MSSWFSASREDWGASLRESLSTATETAQRLAEQAKTQAGQLADKPEVQQLRQTVQNSGLGEVVGDLKSSLNARGFVGLGSTPTTLGQPLPSGGDSVKIFQAEVKALRAALASGCETPLLTETLQCWEERLAGEGVQSELSAFVASHEALVCFARSKVLDRVLAALAESILHCDVLRAAAAAGRAADARDVTTACMLMPDTLLFRLLRRGAQASPDLLALLLELLADAARERGDSGLRGAEHVEVAEQNLVWVLSLISVSFTEAPEVEVLGVAPLAAVAERTLADDRVAVAEGCQAVEVPDGVNGGDGPTSVNPDADDGDHAKPEIGSDIWALSPEDGNWYRAQLKAWDFQEGVDKAKIAWLRRPADSEVESQEYLKEAGLDDGTWGQDFTTLAQGCVVPLAAGRPRRWRGLRCEDPLAEPVHGARLTNFIAGPATAGEGGGVMERWSSDAEAADIAAKRGRDLRDLAEVIGKWIPSSEPSENPQADCPKAAVAALASVSRSLAAMRVERGRRAEALQKKREDCAAELAAKLQDLAVAESKASAFSRVSKLEALSRDLTKQQRAMASADAAATAVEALLQERTGAVAAACVEVQRLQAMSPSLAQGIRKAEQARCVKLEAFVATLSQATWGPSAAERLKRDAVGLADLQKMNLRAGVLAEKGWRHAVQRAADDLDSEMSGLANRYKELRQRLSENASQLTKFEAEELS